MAEMKFGLKNTMTESTFEVVVYKIAKEKYEVAIIEISLYSNDDLYAHEVDTFKRLNIASKEQDSIFMYMKENGFAKVKKRFSDIS